MAAGLDVDPLRRGALKALAAWWLVAAVAALLALFAFPIYKGVILGLVPVIIGVGLAFALRYFPRGVLSRIDAAIHRSTPGRWLLVVLLLGLVLRALAVAWPPVPVSDHDTYLQTARRLVAGLGYGNLILWPPGPGTTVAAGILLFGEGTRALAAFHALLGLALVPVLYLGLRAHDEGAARWSSLVAALWPSIVLWNSTLGHETLSALLFAILLVLAIRVARAEGTPWLELVGMGLVAGVMALVRPTAMAVPLLLAATVWLSGRGIAAAIGRAAIMAVLMAVVIAPWTMRNYEKFGQACGIISANSGNVLLSSNHPQSDGIYREPPPMAEPNPCERDRIRGREAWGHIFADPVRFAALSVKRLAFMWGTDTSGLDFVLGSPPRGGERAKQLLSAILQVPWALLVAAWAIGAWKTRGQLPGQGPLTFALLWIALLWLAHALVEPLSRHHIPLIPLIAAVAMPAYWRWVTSRPAAAP